MKQVDHMKSVLLLATAEQQLSSVSLLTRNPAGVSAHAACAAGLRPNWPCYCRPSPSELWKLLVNYDALTLRRTLGGALNAISYRGECKSHGRGASQFRVMQRQWAASSKTVFVMRSYRPRDTESLEQIFKRRPHHLLYPSHPRLHYRCFTHKSHRVRALKTKQMEPLGNRRHANHGSFDWRTYLITHPSGHVGEDWDVCCLLYNMCKQLFQYLINKELQKGWKLRWRSLKCAQSPQDLQAWGPPYSRASVITRTFLLNTGFYLIWEQETQLWQRTKITTMFNDTKVVSLSLSLCLTHSLAPFSDKLNGILASAETVCRKTKWAVFNIQAQCWKVTIAYLHGDQ